METSNLPTIKIDTALQNHLDKEYLNFLGSILILKRYALSQENLEWFLTEIVIYLQKVFPNKTKEEYSESLYHILRMANLKQ